MGTVAAARRRIQQVASIDATSARDALDTCSVADAIDELEQDWQALDERRALRAPRAFGLRVQPQCPGCRKFVQSLARPCGSCGYYGDAGYPQ